MRVLYDIAVLGLGHHQERARTGVFRVVENVALELACASGLGLEFCTTAVPLHCDDYLKTRPELAHIPLRTAPVWMGAHRLKMALAKDAAARGPGWNLRRVVRGSVFVAAELVRRCAPTLSMSQVSCADIYHSPFYPLPAKTRRIARLRRFLTVYDLIAVLRPDLFENNVTKLIRKALASLSPDDWVLCISEATRRDLLNYRTDLDPEKVLVTPLAAAAHFRPDLRQKRWEEVRRKYSLPDPPYLLTLSTLEPRKNIAHAIRCFGRLAAGGEIGDMKLVMVGTKGWMMESIFAELARLGVHSDRVIITGFVPDEDLAPIYSHALMFVYPSLLEGFGLPPLEAMQCGVPVITSNTSSLPEVVGDAGIMVPPTDEEALCRAIATLVGDDEMRQRLAGQALARAATFSWARCAADTIAAYARASRS